MRDAPIFESFKEFSPEEASPVTVVSEDVEMLTPADLEQPVDIILTCSPVFWITDIPGMHLLSCGACGIRIPGGFVHGDSAEAEKIKSKGEAYEKQLKLKSSVPERFADGESQTVTPLCKHQEAQSVNFSTADKTTQVRSVSASQKGNV